MKRYYNLRLEGAQAVDAVRCLSKEGLFPAPPNPPDYDRLLVGIADDKIVIAGVEGNRLISAAFSDKKSVMQLGNQATTSLTGLAARDMYNTAGRCFSRYKLPEP